MSDKVIAKDESMVADASTDVKTEVVAAYHELLHKLKQNKKATQPHMAVVEDGEYHEVLSEEQKLEEEDRVVDSILRETPSDFSKHILGMKHILAQALDDVNQQYVDEHKRLAAIKDTIELKTHRIAELHNIEVGVDTLTALVAAHKEKMRMFDQEVHERRQQFDLEMANKRRELQQEEQKFIYQRDLAREKDRNRYELSKRDLEQELVEIRQKAYKELEEREARVGTAEELNEKIAQFPEELRVAVQKAKDATTKQLTIQFEYENQLAQKELQLHVQKISTLEAKIATLESSITHFEQLKNSFNHLLFNKADA